MLGRVAWGGGLGVGGGACHGEVQGWVNQVGSPLLTGVRFPGYLYPSPISCPFLVAIPFSFRLLWSAFLQASESVFHCQVSSTLTVFVRLDTSSVV